MLRLFWEAFLTVHLYGNAAPLHGALEKGHGHFGVGKLKTKLDIKVVSGLSGGPATQRLLSHVGVQQVKPWGISSDDEPMFTRALDHH